MATDSGQLNSFPGFHHPLLTSPFHPDPGPSVVHKMHSPARLEIISGRNLSAVRLDEAGLDGEVLSTPGALLRDPIEQPAVGFVLTRDLHCCHVVSAKHYGGNLEINKRLVAIQNK